MDNLLERLFGKKEREPKDVFTLGQCYFVTEGDVDPLEHIKQNKFFGFVEMENLHFLFENLPVRRFDYKNRRECEKDPVFECIHFMVCVFDIYNWSCHQAAPYLSIEHPEYDYMLGFAQQKMDTGETNTFIHSFNAKGEIFFDPTIQAKYQQQVLWARWSAKNAVQARRFLQVYWFPFSNRSGK